MEDYTLDNYDADMLEYFKDDIELRKLPEEGEFTAVAFCEYVNSTSDVEITGRIARTWLDRAVTEGKVTMRTWRNERGHDNNLYRWVK